MLKPVKDKLNESDKLIIAVKELALQYEEKEKRAAELVAANKELVFQNKEKGKLAAELVVANKELLFQNKEKEQRADELVVANKELAFQNEEKGKRASELIIANKELVFQNEEKEKRAAELIIVNKELLAFTYISSHDLQEPIRKIQSFASIVLKEEEKNLSDQGKKYILKMQAAAVRMQQLIHDLLAYSQINAADRTFEKADLNMIIEEVKADLCEIIEAKQAIIEITTLCVANIIPFQFRQLMENLISNALKFSHPDIPPHILIYGKIEKGNPIINELLLPNKDYCHIVVKDNGIGFSQKFSERIFEVFQRLHSKEEYAGTGIGLAIVRKIIENHKGIVIATSELEKGARFDMYIPAV